MLGVGVLVVAGMSANTIGETRGIYLFYGDAGMGLMFLIMLEVAWVVITTIAAAVAAPFALRRWRRINRDECASCGYSLRGRAPGRDRCPECGKPV